MLCPICRVKFRRIYKVASPSTHVEEGCKYGKLAELVTSFQQRNESSVIFVQWNSVLTAACKFLQGRLPVLRLSGNNHSRHKTLQKFANDEAKVLFLSLENSSSGLNLIKANHVVFLHAIVDTNAKDVEAQAIGRVARLGQSKHVTVHHLIMDDSIDRRIFETISRPNLVEE
jgi:SNF2 family DNA or RNA helicase